MSEVPEPDIYFADDGEVKILWDRANVYFDLGFYGDGTYSCYGKDAIGNEVFEEEVAAKEGLTNTVRAILSA